MYLSVCGSVITLSYGWNWRFVRKVDYKSLFNHTLSLPEDIQNNLLARHLNSQQLGCQSS